MIAERRAPAAIARLLVGARDAAARHAHLAVLVGAMLGLAAPALAQAPPDAAPPGAPAPPTGAPAPPTGTPAPPTGAPAPPTGTPAPPTGAPPTATPPDAPGAPAQPTFEPPRALGATDVPYPPGAPSHSDPIVVTVKLTVDTTGAVQKIDPVTPPQAVFDEAVAAAVREFRFDPATYGGKPVPVEITFTHTFLPPPPPPPPAETGPPRTSILRGKLVELGTRAAVQGATVTAKIGEHSYTADADQRGRFELPLPEGRASITVTAPGHNVFLQQESLAARQQLAVTYLVERDRYDPYEIVVVGEQRREEVSRITLRGPELQQVPGTFGDPFRVIQALPGVASVVSLLPFPIVRGATPSSTGFLLDGTRVPLLFHLLSGPSVIHPHFIDEVQFYPGGAPVLYGGYTGGIVDGRTARARRDEHLLDFDANLLQLGGLVRQPLPWIGATVTAAARYGYPGLVLSLATDQASLSYWDYQLRLDGGTPRNGWTIFLFGANDELDTVPPDADPNEPTPPLEPSLILEFHRLDLRLHQTYDRVTTSYRAVLGFDKTYSDSTDFSVLDVEPAIHVGWKRDDTLTLAAGVSGALHRVSQGEDRMPEVDDVSRFAAELSTFTTLSALAEAHWRPTRDWLIRPGVRGDIYSDDTASKSAIDPRLTVRYQLARRDLDDVPPNSDDSAVWLKGSAGVYHQPPRFVVPLPGLDLMPIKYGLLRSFQTSLGVELPLRDRLQLAAESYFNYMDPTIFDLAVNRETVILDPNSGLVPDRIVTGGTDNIIDRLARPQLGRSYGLEVMVRRSAKSGIFGWISYTLSRAERQRKDEWVPYDFDRSHLINVVAGLPLRRNWDVGLRLQYQSGKPETTTSGYNTARTAGYLRFDLRVDKRAVWRSWLLDFYVDITNAAVLPEEVQVGTVLRYVLPTVGLRGRF